MQEMTNVPPAQWGKFLAQFSAEHYGQETDVETIAGDDSAMPIAIRLPLIGLQDTAQPGAAPEVHVCAGDQTGTIDSAVVNPVRIAVRDWAEGSAELEMESRGGQAIRVRVRGNSAAVQ